MTGHLVDSETGELLLDGSGNAYVQEVAFEPEEGEGSLEVPFEIDASSLSGKTTVFTETLSDAEGNVIAVHDDTANANQSIYFPMIRTTAVDGADGDKNLVAGESAIVVDTVSYENLIPGKEYVVSGVLMDKATGEPLKDAQGNGVSASATFTPDSPFSIVYGRHMDDGSVFADFARFSDKGYAEGHRGIRVSTRVDDRVCELRVVAVDVVDADEERVRASFGSDGERVAYLNERISSSDFVLEEADLSDSKVWAFATCSYQTSNSRTVVYAIEDRR